MTDTNTDKAYHRAWWKECVVYQIYPRSFMDTNGDGIGDLAGIIQKLDYIKGLGVDVIWLSPHFESPNADNGYDIRDYRSVMSEFGTMADFDSLLAQIKARGMRLIIDLVVNHSSDEHDWFKQARTSADNPYRDYYIWRKGKEGGPPNNWTSIFTGPAWTRDEASGEYYLHLFGSKQPDLNWENPKLRHEVYDVMRFWLDKGVDGFRMDVIPFISKDRNFPDCPDEHKERPQYYYANGPRLHEFLQEMHHEVLRHYDIMTVGEAFGVTLKQTPLLVDEDRYELNMVFQFDAVEIDRDKDGQWKSWDLRDFKAIFTRHDAALSHKAWQSIFLSNHDNPRLLSRFGDVEEPWRVASAKLLATLLLTLKGTPFIYQGDELGMENYPFSHIEQFDDIWVKQDWQQKRNGAHFNVDAFIENQNKVSRDHARTPMQWDKTRNAGFTSADKAWLAVNTNYDRINAETAFDDLESIYHYYAKLMSMRKSEPALIYGEFEDLAPDHKDLFVYRRRLGARTVLVVLNFSRKAQVFELPKGMQLADKLIENGHVHTASLTEIRLKGWGACVYAIK